MFRKKGITVVNIPDKYVAWNGMVRQWKYTDEEQERQHKNSGCYDCNRPYKRSGDCCVFDHVWELINPTYQVGAGLLCANCIHERLRILGIAPTTATLW